MHQKRGLVLALVVLLAAPLVAAGGTQARFHSTTITWISNQPDLSGSIVGLRSRAGLLGNSTAAPSALDSQFQLQAEKIDVETDATSLYTETPALFYSPAPFLSHRITTYHQALVQGKESKLDRFVYIFPTEAGSIRASTDCASAAKPTGKEIRDAPMVNASRPAFVADVSSTLAIQPCPDSPLTVAGSFRLSLWQWNSTLSSREGDTFLWSGKSHNTLPEAVSPAKSYAGPGQQLYLTVTNGTFTLPGSSRFPLTLYMVSPQVQAIQATLLEGSGSIPALGADVAGQTIQLRGVMRLDLGQSQKGISTRVEGDLHLLEVDGRQIVLASTAAVPGRHERLLAFAGLFGMVAGSALAVPLLLRRRNRGHRRIQVVVGHARDLANRLRFEEALPLCEKALAWQPRHAEANLLHATVLARLGRPIEALRGHERAEVMLRGLGAPELVAENALEAARAAALLCAEASAQRQHWIRIGRDWLERAKRADGGMEDVLHLHPELRLLGEASPREG